MSANLQEIARRFYDTKSERDFNTFYREFSPVVRSISKKILKDEHDVEHNVSEVFMKLYTNAFKKFVFDETRSHLSYVYTMATNRAKFTYRKKQRDLLVTESMLTGHCEDETEMGSILDIIFNNEGSDEYMPDFDFSYLHNDASKREARVLQLIKSMGTETGELLRFAWGLTTDEEEQELEMYEIMPVPYMVDEPSEEEVRVQNARYDRIARKFGLNTPGAVKTRVFRAKANLRELLVRELNGTKRQDGDTTISGEADFYYESGLVRHRAGFENGVMHGSFTRWFDSVNGEPQIVSCRGEYNMGVKVGLWQSYYPTGRTKVEGRYQHGRPSGLWSRYYSSGRIMETVDHFDGMGFFELHDEEGGIRETGLVDVDEQGRQRVAELEEEFA